MKKNIVSSVCIITYLSLMCTGCSSFKETYKPLYQVKPMVEKLKGE